MIISYWDPQGVRLLLEGPLTLNPKHKYGLALPHDLQLSSILFGDTMVPYIQ